MFDILPILLRYAHVAALMLACGTGLVLGWLTPPALAAGDAGRAGRVYGWCTAVVVIGAMLMVPLQAGRMAESWQAAATPDYWLAVLRHTSYGQAWLWQLLLAPLMLLALFAGRGRTPAHRSMALAAAAMMVALAGTGHAAAMDGAQGWLHRGNQALHLLAVAYWAGGLPWVIAHMRALNGALGRAAATALVRYSRYGHIAVALVLLSGLFNLRLILGPWPWDWQTLYMRLMETKFLAVALMVGLALVNRYVLVPRLRAHPEALGRLVRNTRMEVALAILILLLIGVISSLSPTPE